MCTSASAGVSFQSGVNQTTLIELYSSEGCSSCPAAESWLSALKGQEGLWKDFVPVALHVDYWDALGWKDKFASPKFTQRQRKYADTWRANTVYTPGFIVNGEEWRGWYEQRSLVTNNKDRVGVLTIEANGDNQFQITFEPQESIEGAMKVHIALLGFDLETQVRSGENSGKLLKHDFVALNYDETKLKQKDNQWVADFQLSPKKGFTSSQLAVVAWVTSEDGLTPIQATGGYLS